MPRLVAFGSGSYVCHAWCGVSNWRGLITPSASLLCSDRDEEESTLSRPPFADAFVGMICSQRQVTLSLERLGKRTLTRSMMGQRWLYVNDGCARLCSCVFGS